MEYVLTRAAENGLKGLDGKLRRRVQVKIEEFAADPERLSANVKALKGDRAGALRLRAGSARVICQVRDDRMEVLAIGLRGHIY